MSRLGCSPGAPSPQQWMCTVSDWCYGRSLLANPWTEQQAVCASPGAPFFAGAAWRYLRLYSCMHARSKAHLLMVKVRPCRKVPRRGNLCSAQARARPASIQGSCGSRNNGKFMRSVDRKALCRVPKECPESVWTLCQACLEEDPTQRPSSADIAKEIAAAIAGHRPCC